MIPSLLLNFPTRRVKRKTKCGNVFCELHDHWSKCQVLFLVKYLIDFTSKLCCLNLCTHHQRVLTSSDAKILRFIFINPNREWKNEKTCQWFRGLINGVCLNVCHQENVFCFLSVPTETADIGIIKQPVQINTTEHHHRRQQARHDSFRSVFQQLSTMILGEKKTANSSNLRKYAKPHSLCANIYTYLQNNRKWW